MNIHHRLFVRGLKPATWEAMIDRAEPSIALACRVVDHHRAGHVPHADVVFAALDATPLSSVRVILAALDPYPRDSNGVAFSCDVRVPDTLRSIYKELERSVPGFITPSHGDLSYWSSQGVLLLNVQLTTAPGVTDAHPGVWIGVIKHIVDASSSGNPNVVYAAVGVQAHRDLAKVLPPGTNILKIPDPLGRGGFMGCDCFLKINAALQNSGQVPIDWCLPLDPRPPLVDFSQ